MAQEDILERGQGQHRRIRRLSLSELLNFFSLERYLRDWVSPTVTYKEDRTSIVACEFLNDLPWEK